MAPIPRADFDMDNPSSDVGDSQDQDSPLRRQFSESFRPQSTSTQISQSPEPVARKIKCDWCGKLLELREDDSISEEDLLNFHIASDHPNSHSFEYEEGEDGEDGVDADELELDEEEEEAMNDASQFEENEDAYQVEEGDEVEGVDEAEDAEDVEDVELTEHAGLAEAEEAEPGEENEQEQGTPIASATNGDNSEVDTSKTSSVSFKVAPQAPGKLDTLEWLSNPRGAFPEDFRRRLVTWQEADIKNRLPKVWNVHKPEIFSDSYDQDMAKVEATWQYVFGDKPKKKDVSEPLARPVPYKNSQVPKGQFLEINSFEELIETLRKPELLSPDELYAATEAVAAAMKTWQDEYIALDKLYIRTHRHYRAPLPSDAKREQHVGHKKRTGQPLARVSEHERDFEDRKESMLYGYKHNFFGHNLSNAVSWVPQNPFVQGGFVPTPAQARKMATKVAPDDRNPDGWAPVLRDGVEFVPKLWEARREPVVKLTRKRKAVEVEPAKLEEAEDTQNESEIAEESEEDARPVKRRTRGRGGRRTTLDTYQPPEAPTSAPRGRGGSRARGRGRGRGAGRTTSARASLDAPQSGTFASPTSYRGRGRRGASIVSSTQTHSAEDTPTSLPNISPMPEATPPPKANASMKRDATAEEMEEARRLKIANSKNPKRTKAMLDHWERFNREGRIRNPKRSKAQIESDRHDDPIKSDVMPRAPGRRRKSPSLAPIPNGNLAPKAPVGAPMTSHMGPGPTLPPLGMPQYAPPNPYAQPPPNVPIGQQLPPQYAPFPYVPYAMSHMQGPPPGPHPGPHPAPHSAPHPAQHPGLHPGPHPGPHSGPHPGPHDHLHHRRAV